MVEPVMLWRSYGLDFDTKEEAEQYEKEREFEEAVGKIVESFYYRDIEESDIVQGIIDNKVKLVEVMSK